MMNKIDANFDLKFCETNLEYLNEPSKSPTSIVGSNSLAIFSPRPEVVSEKISLSSPVLPAVHNILNKHNKKVIKSQVSDVHSIACLEELTKS
jgi:hypothetical protein